MSDVNYAFAAIVEQEDVDETWVPKIIDKAGTVAWTAADGEVTGFLASGLTVYRGQIDARHRLLHVEKVEIKVFVSRARLVAVCRKYDKGGGWIGGLGGMIVLNSISKARAAVRSHGKFLVGQMRWPWLADVGYTEKSGWSSTNKLRLVAQDGSTGQWIYVDLQLPKRASARELADAVLRTATRERAGGEQLDAEDRQVLASLALPPFDPSAKRFSMVNVPAAKQALASTAFLGQSVRNGDGNAEPPAAPTAVAEPPAPPTAVAEPPAPPTAVAEPPAPESPVVVSPTCASCEAPLHPGARFCRQCGTPVDRAAATAAVGDLTPTREDEPESTAATSRHGPAGAATALLAGAAVRQPAPSTAHHRPPPLARATAPQASPPQPSKGGRVGLIAALAVLVVAAGVAGGYFLVGDHQSAPKQQAARAAAETRQTTTATAADQTTTATEADQTSTPTADDQSTVPVTTDTTTDARGSANPTADDSSAGSAAGSDAPAPALAGAVVGDGFTIRPPAGWAHDSDEVDKGGFVESRWHEPGSPDVHFLIDHTNGYTASARTGAEAVRAAVRSAPTYHELAWRADTPDGWRWAFTVAGNRSVDRFRSACGNGYAMLGHAPTATYARYAALFDAVTRSVQFTC